MTKRGRRAVRGRSVLRGEQLAGPHASDPDVDEVVLGYLVDDPAGIIVSLLIGCWLLLLRLGSHAPELTAAGDMGPAKMNDPPGREDDLEGQLGRFGRRRNRSLPLGTRPLYRWRRPRRGTSLVSSRSRAVYPLPIV